MRSHIMIALSIFVLAALNYGVYANQKIIDNGEVVLLMLAPVDPRSLMQGDFMRLRYDLERSVPSDANSNLPERGYMMIQADENNVAALVRIHDGEPLNDGEKLLHFNKKRGLQIMPNSFMFQEGHAEHYDNAVYGFFKFDDGGKHILVGLANEDGKTITVSE